MVWKSVGSAKSGLEKCRKCKENAGDRLEANEDSRRTYIDSNLMTGCFTCQIFRTGHKCKDSARFVLAAQRGLIVAKFGAYFML